MAKIQPSAGFRAVSASPCGDRRAQFMTQWGAACRLNECRRHERRRHHPLSTGARRATSASRGAERSAAPTNRAPKVRGAPKLSGKRPAERQTPPKFRARGGQLAELANRAFLFPESAVFNYVGQKFWRTKLLCQFSMFCEKLALPITCAGVSTPIVVLRIIDRLFCKTAYSAACSARWVRMGERQLPLT